MKAAVLYSGGKDSSLMAILLKRMAIELDLVTINFGVYDSYISAQKSAKALNLNHKVIKLDKSILKSAIDIINSDGFPNNGINFIHKEVIENIAKLSQYDIIADGTRRDDKVPKLNKNDIQSLEDRFNIQYINLDSFGYKTIDLFVNKFFYLKKEKSHPDKSSDYEVEIRKFIDENGGNSSEIFPIHYQTKVNGLKEDI
ncbi:DUF7411 family protein [Methanobrevibacter curvatus]|uniref:Uncharacterized protein n=1 Tax=Methanobrevibacter curvatus TaxID=49547 RepID=A0A166B6C2_9EURY|nr:7-cyano-7-deazaguanine synthase [Methanobrevibacter curvatus]KZX12922.1 hypothetical protein MBCUR_08110 [Methanobrevibacter curvatus]